MKNSNILFFLIVLIAVYSARCTEKINIEKAYSAAAQQTKVMLKEVAKVKKTTKPELVSPRTVLRSGELRLVSSSDWTSGFFPGILWYLYEYTGDNFWLARAKDFTADIEQEKWNAGTHDMGFKVYCSFGNGYRLTGNKHFRAVVVQSARTLAKRYNPKVGAIRSWDHNADKWDFPVIIDNMMNLELLFAATRFTGDSSFYNVAVSHANTTMNNHFREDNSSYHVISYDPNTGTVEKKNTHQGYSDESAWARGQAWGLYGYTMCYRETKDSTYLEQAEKIAHYILNHPHLPDDMVPYWDFDAPNIPEEERDVSAAAIMASGLYELSAYSDEGKYFCEAADKILKNLYKKYTAPIGTHRGFILLHSVGSKPGDSEVDAPLVYADYYYLEALLRSKRLKAGKNPVD